jgi:hypothetical protein
MILFCRNTRPRPKAAQRRMALNLTRGGVVRLPEREIARKEMTKFF